MKLNEQMLLEIRLDLEKLISEREAMIAENQQRFHLEASMAYSGDDFIDNAEKIAELKTTLVHLGEK